MGVEADFLDFISASTVRITLIYKIPHNFFSISIVISLLKIALFLGKPMV